MKNMIRDARRSNVFGKVSVRTSPSERAFNLDEAPIRAVVSVRMDGRYPVPESMYQEMERVYDRLKPDLLAAKL